MSAVVRGAVMTTGEWDLMFARDIEMQVWSTDSEHRKNKLLGSFKIINGAKGAALYVCMGSEKLVFYQLTVKIMQAKSLVQEETKISAYSVLIRHGCFYQTGLELYVQYCPAFTVTSSPMYVAAESECL